jgi:hypothetical protein
MRVLKGMLFAVVIAACHHDAPPPEEPTNTPPSTAPDMGQNGTMVSPDTVEGVNRALDHKSDSISRCLADAVDHHEAPRNAKGTVEVEIVVDGGHATKVNIVNTSIDSQLFKDCVVKRVKEIAFPTTEHYETSHGYTVEAI